MLSGVRLTPIEMLLKKEHNTVLGQIFNILES